MSENPKQLKLQLKRINLSIDLLKLLRILLIGIICVFGILNYVIKPLNIKGNSMYPTIESGDTGITSIISVYLGDINRFDILTVYSPNEDRNLTKRVIGLPNETIEYKNDVLYINGEYVSEEFLDKEYVASQTNDGERKFTEDFGPITLEDDEYFLIGDNRIISVDSRVIGPFKKEDILSKYFFKLY